MKRFAKIFGILAIASIVAVGCGNKDKNDGVINNTEVQDSDQTDDSNDDNDNDKDDSSKDSDSDDSEDDRSSSKRSIPKEGEDAPEVDITSLEDGSQLNMEQLKGKRTLINFFATWCGPCKQEMPDLEKLYQNYGEEYNIIAVSSNESDEALEKFKSDMNLGMPIYKDSSDSKTIKSYFVRVVPTTYMVDENGKIEHIIPGVMSYEDMETLVKGV